MDLVFCSEDHLSSAGISHLVISDLPGRGEGWSKCQAEESHSCSQCYGLLCSAGDVNASVGTKKERQFMRETRAMDKDDISILRMLFNIKQSSIISKSFPIFMWKKKYIMTFNSQAMSLRWLLSMQFERSMEIIMTFLRVQLTDIKSPINWIAHAIKSECFTILHFF